ncbi:MAG: hypothetical protein Q8P49_04330 [Candidatus Liptonbacteria bacterium]|nr:hypothetical protein [Candidatus Liptonbacteria bacterium]
MKRKNSTTTTYIVLFVLVVAAIGFLVYPSVAPGPSNLGPFASCLKDKGVIFYGAFWCPHCQTQKKLFGDAVDQLPYVECSTPDGQGRLQICVDKGIQGYPTWVFPDGSRLSGEVPLNTLAEKSSCTLPQQ